MNDSNGKIKSRDSKIIWGLIGVLILILTNFATYIIGTTMPIKGTRRISEATYEDLVKFNKLFIVKENLYKFYDGNIDEEALVDGAIKGMTESLKDPYTVYMNTEEFKEFNTQTEGNYVGLGLQVGVKDDKVVVIAPFEDSPAKKAGILSGDVIEKVDGKEVNGKEYEKAVAMMRGEKDTYVTLTITREGKGTFDVKVKREEITLITVTGEMVDDNIGYVQITVFDEHTDEQFNKVTADLKKKGMKAMILDLRQNPGGWLTQAINITSKFVPKDKVIVSTEDKNGNKEEYKSKGGDLIGMPLVVLTDGGTASASEIFSGAIRDYNLGTLVGENTFGKGIVQSVLYEKKYGFGDGTALKVTTSKYYTPKGENIHHKGIKPNIEVKYPKELSEKPYDKKTDPQFIKALEVIKEKVK
ncbi:MAG: S41 family peptidase [Clostridium thermopalmarium]|uniref:S41 family peptidase n=1 Tax=Clostridium thermopalmarium TaxID=29373 RepID=UPI0023530761|nr:S41 family peptidase [Clostridium thermopalmarium]MBE6043010.1 S41 family peptidase [Clostridium thermopalmarium]